MPDKNCLRVFAGFLPAIALFFSCPAWPDDRGEVRIGLFTELSGSFAASAGGSCREGYETARHFFAPGDKLGNLSLKFIYGDTRGDAKTAMSEFAKLLNVDKAQVLATNRTQVCMALNPVAKQHQFPIVSVCGGSKVLDASPYAFQFYPNAAMEAAALAKQIWTSGFQRVAIITLQDEWFVSFAENFRNNYLALGGEIAFEQQVGEEQIDFLALAALLRKASPAAILANLGPTQTGPAIRQLRTQGVRQQLFGNYYTRSAEVLENAGRDALEGLITVEIDLQKPLFKARHKQLFPASDANPLTYTCFAGLSFILEAIRDRPAPESPRQMASALELIDTLNLPDEKLVVSERRALYKIGFRIMHKGVPEPLSQ